MPQTTEQAITALIKEALPNATIDLNDYKHDGLHIILTVTSSHFKNLNLVDQHRLVYKAVQPLLDDGTVHALKIKTIPA